MLTTFFHADCVLNQDHDSTEDGVHPERRKRTELAMAEGLTKLTKNLKQKNER